MADQKIRRIYSDVKWHSDFLLLFFFSNCFFSLSGCNFWKSFIFVFLSFILHFTSNSMCIKQQKRKNELSTQILVFKSVPSKTNQLRNFVSYRRLICEPIFFFRKKVCPTKHETFLRMECFFVLYISFLVLHVLPFLKQC